MFESSLGRVYRKQGNSIFVEVSHRDFGKTILRLKAKGIEHISAITGYDNGKEIELLYHFAYEGRVLSIKTKLDRKKPVIGSIVKHFPGAELYERECFEMLGISFQGNPNLRHVVLDTLSPKTPLMKDSKREGEHGKDK